MDIGKPLRTLIVEPERPERLVEPKRTDHVEPKRADPVHHPGAPTDEPDRVAV
ncbi:MAG TPA: hypothetical protein VNL18_16255 [Gemmatimonadales bacterium]|nr:hypothetical protein [Gemmatimonadales bacterium]